MKDERQRDVEGDMEFRRHFRHVGLKCEQGPAIRAGRNGATRTTPTSRLSRLPTGSR